MAHDIRRILFGHPHVLTAVRDYAVSQKRLRIEASAVRAVTLEHGPAGPTCRVVTGPRPSDRNLMLSNDELVRAIVMFCLGEGIPLPARGIKTLEFVADQLALIIRRIYAGDADAQDWAMSITNVPSHATPGDGPPGGQGRVDELPDVRVVSFNASEVRGAVADHLVHVTRNDALRNITRLDLEAGPSGVFARAAFAVKTVGGSRILPPPDLLRAVFAFCKKHKIGLPARSPKWLVIREGDRLSLVIAQYTPQLLPAKSQPKIALSAR